MKWKGQESTLSNGADSFTHLFKICSLTICARHCSRAQQWTKQPKICLHGAQVSGKQSLSVSNLFVWELPSEAPREGEGFTHRTDRRWTLPRWPTVLDAGAVEWILAFKELRIPWGEPHMHWDICSSVCWRNAQATLGTEVAGSVGSQLLRGHRVDDLGGRWWEFRVRVSSPAWRKDSACGQHS